MTSFTNDSIVTYANKMRTLNHYLTLEELLNIHGDKNTIFDPFSLLISRDVKIGYGNIFYPNVVILLKNGGSLHIGNENIFFPGTFICADVGSIFIGSQNEIGEGGISLKANHQEAHISMADSGRYLGNAQIMGHSTFGHGCQVLGPLLLQNVTLEGGESFTFHDPDSRGAVLKNLSPLRNLTLKKGEVLNYQSSLNLNFEKERQSSYHKKI